MIKLALVMLLWNFYLNAMDRETPPLNKAALAHILAPTLSNDTIDDANQNKKPVTFSPQSIPSQNHSFHYDIFEKNSSKKDFFRQIGILLGNPFDEKQEILYLLRKFALITPLNKVLTTLHQINFWNNETKNKIHIECSYCKHVRFEGSFSCCTLLLYYHNKIMHQTDDLQRAMEKVQEKLQPKLLEKYTIQNDV